MNLTRMSITTSDIVWPRLAKALGIPWENCSFARIEFKPGAAVTVHATYNTGEIDKDQLETIEREFEVIEIERGLMKPGN